MQVQTLLERVGVGPTHIWMVLALSLVEIINGYKIVIISLISPYLKSQWNLNEEVKNIPLAFYFGIILGSLLAGTLANFSGRKLTLFIGQLFQVVSSVFLIYTTEYISFLLTLIFSGIGFGVTLIMANTLLSQQMPQKYRGKSLVFLSFIAILGKFFAIIFGYTFQLQNWRKSEIFMIVIGVIVLVIVFAKIPESLRALLLNGQLEQSRKIYQKLLKQQKKGEVTEDQIKIMKEITKKNGKSHNTKAKFRQIFKKKAMFTTIMLSVCWFTVNFMFTGQLFIMPFLFQSKQSGKFLQFSQMIFGEVPSILLTFNMIQREKFGRKNSTGLFFFVSAVLNLILVYYESNFIISVSRLAMKCILQILYPFTAQSFSTPLRTSGLAFCSGMGRLGSIVMPIIVYWLYQQSSYLVFVSFLIASILGLFCSLSTRETLHHSLDTDYEDMNEQISILDKQQSQSH